MKLKILILLQNVFVCIWIPFNNADSVKCVHIGNENVTYRATTKFRTTEFQNSQVIKGYGYPVEVYAVKTNDSYILHMQRIPPKRPTKKVVFLLHGLVSNGADFVINRSNKSLGFMLHNEGFDVWLGNVRGTRVSQKHEFLNTKQQKYWDFSFHEIAIYDVPAMIDFILKKTNRSSIQYIGHSQGTTTLMILLSLYPEYNKKIISAHLLSPAIYFNHARPLLQMAANYWPILKEILDSIEIYAVPTAFELLSYFVDLYCVKLKTNQSTQQCMELYHSLSFAGPIEEQFDMTIVPTVLKNSPSASSYKQFWHFSQLMQRKKFAQYDYGKENNLKIYNSEEPPLYNLSNVKVNLQISYATIDSLVNSLDAENFLKDMKEHVFDVVILEGWNHLDYLFAIEAHSRIYQKVIDALHQQHK